MQLTEQEAENCLKLLQSIDEDNILLGLTILKGFKEYPEEINIFLSIPIIKKYINKERKLVIQIKKYNENIIKVTGFFKAIIDAIGEGIYEDMHFTTGAMPSGKEIKAMFYKPLSKC